VKAQKVENRKNLFLLLKKREAEEEKEIERKEKKFIMKIMKS